MVKQNFLQLRQIMNDYVREERSRGMRLQLSFDDEEEPETDDVLPATPRLTDLNQTQTITTNPAGPSSSLPYYNQQTPSNSQFGRPQLYPHYNLSASQPFPQTPQPTNIPPTNPYQTPFNQFAPPWLSYTPYAQYPWQMSLPNAPTSQTATNTAGTTNMAQDNHT